MRLLLRLSTALAILSALTLFGAPAPAHADTNTTRTTINLCEQFNLDPCPAGAANVDLEKTKQLVLANGCTYSYASLEPGVLWYYDPSVGYSYPILYQGVSVEAFCTKPAALSVEALSQPTALTRAGSKTHEEQVCPSALYCEATAVWAHSQILDQPVCAYSEAGGTLGAKPMVPYIPSWTIAGVNCL